eukprot:Em0008g654a
MQLSNSKHFPSSDHPFRIKKLGKKIGARCNNSSQQSATVYYRHIAGTDRIGIGISNGSCTIEVRNLLEHLEVPTTKQRAARWRQAQSWSIARALYYHIPNLHCSKNTGKWNSCKRSAGRHYRHSAINDIIHRALVAAHVPSRLEPSGLYCSDGKRPDGITTVPWKCGQLLVWDATCPDTYAPSYSTIAAQQAGAVGQQAEDKKAQKYKHLSSHHFFTPVAIETSGVYGPRTAGFLKELGHRLRQVSAEASSFHYLAQRLSVAIQRGNSGLSAHLEEGSSWSIEKPKSRPADIIVANWDRGFSAAFDVSVISPLNPLHIVEAGISPGAAAKATEERKHRNNDAKCEELGWRCIPMVVESYGCWGTEARQPLSQLASRLAVRTNTYKSQMLNSLYGRLNLTLIKCNARAILSRSHFASCEQVVPDDVFV